MRAIHLAISFSVVASACTVDLNPADGTAIRCASDNECPGSWRCVAGLCQRLGANTLPTATFGRLARSLSPISVPVTVVDTDADTVTVDLSVRTPLLAERPATLIGNAPVAASATGASVTLIWDSATDVGSGYVADVQLGLTPHDKAGAGATTWSELFAVGNDAPTVSDFTPDGNTVSGLAVVRFKVEDTASDPVAITSLRLSLVGDFASDPAPITLSVEPGAGQDIPSGTTDGLTTSVSGVTHSFVWDSEKVADVDANNVKLELCVTETLPGVAADAVCAESSSFDIHNRQPPRVEPVSAKLEPGTESGAVPIVYRAVDDDSDPIEIVIEYSLDGGQHWSECTEHRMPLSEGRTGLAASPQGIEHVFVWDTTADVFGQWSSLALQIKPYDAYSGAGETVALSAGVWSVGPPPVAPTAGLFGTPSVLTIAGRAESAATGRLDGDLDMDLVINVTSPSPGVQPWLNAGDGTFVGGTAATATGPVTDLHLVDANSDGDLDALGTCGQGAAFFYNNGAGVFANAVDLGCDGNSAAGVTFGHFSATSLGRDVASARVIDGVVRIWPNTGNSGGVPIFGTPRNLTVPSVSDVSSSDLDGDGVDEIIALAADAAPLWIFWGHDDYATPDKIATVLSPSALLVADLDQDGRNDLAVSSVTHGSVSVFWGQAGGLDPTPDLFAAGGSEMIAGDVNGDGLVDLLVQTEDITSSNRVVLLIAEPTSAGRSARFGPPLSMSVGAIQTGPGTSGHRPRGGAVADFNGDAAPDLALADGNDVSVLLANEPANFDIGSFSMSGRILLPDVPSSLVVADLNSDGLVDAIVGSNSGVRVFWGNGEAHAAGGLGETTSFFATPAGVVKLQAGDFTGDGFVDVAAMANGTLYLFDGDGRGDFSAPRPCTLDGSDRDLAAADFNGDGVLDLTSCSDNNAVTILVSIAGSTATCPFVITPPTLVAPCHTLATGDIDRDGDVDIVAITYGATAPVRGAQAFINNGGAVFTGPVTTSVSATPPGFLESILVDMNGDEIPDLVAPYRVTGVQVWRGNGNGTFQAPSTIQGGTFVDVAAADLNRDGVLDLVATDMNANSVRIMAGASNGGLGTGALASSYQLGVDVVPSQVVITNVNSDAEPDLVVLSVAGHELSTFVGHDSGFRQMRVRQLTAANVVGAVLDPASNLHSAAALNTFTMRPFHAEVDLALEAAGMGFTGTTRLSNSGAGERPTFVQILRESGISQASYLNPYTATWTALGDVRWARVQINGESRLRIEPRFGPRTQPNSTQDFSRAGLDLAAVPPRGILVDLPILTGAAAPGGGQKIIVYAHYDDWQRADEICGDPLGPSTCQTNATPGSSKLLGRVNGQDAIRARGFWERIERAPSNDLDQGSGRRFVTAVGADGKGVIRLLTDRLGVFQAFVTPAT